MSANGWQWALLHKGRSWLVAPGRSCQGGCWPQRSTVGSSSVAKHGPMQCGIRRARQALFHTLRREEKFGSPCAWSFLKQFNSSNNKINLLLEHGIRTGMQNMKHRLTQHFLPCNLCTRAVALAKFRKIFYWVVWCKTYANTFVPNNNLGATV